MGDEYAELFAQGLSGDIPFHKLVFKMKCLNVDFIPDEVGEQLNKDITDMQIEEAEKLYKLAQSERTRIKWNVY